MSSSSPLIDALDTDLIEVQSNISSRKKLLQKIAKLLSTPCLDELHSQKPKLENKSNNVTHEQDQDDEDRAKSIEKEIYHLLLEREKLGNTCIGNGVALPHCRYQSATQARLAILILSEPVDFDSLDGQGVEVVFGIIVPEEASQEHLNLLASVARIMSDPEHRDLLAEAHSAQQVVNYITDWSRPAD